MKKIVSYQILTGFDLFCPSWQFVLHAIYLPLLIAR